MFALYQYRKIISFSLVPAGVLFVVSAYSGDILNYTKSALDMEQVCDATYEANAEYDAPATLLAEYYGQKGEKKYSPIGRPIKKKGVAVPITTLYNVHTREILPVFDTPAVDTKLLSYFLRSRGFGFKSKIDPRLLEAVINAAVQFETKKISVISGYRSPKFNSILAKKGRHVATRSRHMKGQAIDVRFENVDAAELGKWFRKVFDGGVGTYRHDNFVHIDVGPKRSWFGN